MSRICVVIVAIMAFSLDLIDSVESNERNPLLSVNLTSLALYALWPFQSREFLRDKYKRRIHFRIGFFVYCLFFLFLISEYIELFNVWGDLEEMTTNMSVSCLYTLGVMKIYVFYGKREKIRSLVDDISQIELNILKYQNESVKTIMKNYIHRARKVTYFFWSLTIGTIIIFFIIPPIEYQFSPMYHQKYDNGTESWSYVRPMIFSSWFPFDKYKFPNYVIAYIYHIFMGSVGAGYQAIWDMLIITMIIHSIGQLQILQINLTNITSSDLATEKHKRLIDCVTHHRYILSYTRRLNLIIRPAMMMYFMICSLMLCAIGFQASLYGFSIRLCFMIEYLIAMMIQLFLFYWHSNEVMIEVEKLTQATFDSEWYNEGKSFGKNFWIMREGIKLPLRFTVGPFYAMSLPTFLSILRASYSYFALLRQVQND